MKLSDRIYALLLPLLIMGCSDEKKENTEIDFQVLNTDFRIPSAYLSYPDDFKGGLQNTITINAAYPSMEPVLADSDEFNIYLRTGKGVRILLKDHGVTGAQAWEAINKYRGNSIIGMEKINGLTKYQTSDINSFEYFTYKKDDEKLTVISCPKREKSINIILCANKHKIINGEIVVSYIFEERLLKNIEKLDQLVEDVVLGFTKEVNR